MKFSIKDFFSKCNQIRRFLQIWSHLLKKTLVENFIFVQCLFEMYYRIIVKTFSFLTTQQILGKHVNHVSPVMY